MKNDCPICKASCRKPLKPTNAVGAAAYMQFCPQCHRELQYGSGIKMRIRLIVIIGISYAAGLFDAGGDILGMALRIAAGMALLGAWFLLPVFVAGPRRYNEATGMAEDIPAEDSL